MGLSRKCPMRGGGMPFTLERMLDGQRTPGTRLSLRRRTVPALIGSLRTFARFFADLALLRRLQIDASPPRLRQADRDRLLGRPRAMLAFADMVHFLADELAGLRTG